MNRALVSAMSLMLAACVGTDVHAPASSVSESAPTASSAPPEAVAGVRQVDIAAFADDGTVCRREAPTGSRIAVMRCRSSSAEADPADEFLLREDLELMRQQQLVQEQARQARDRDVRQSVLDSRR